MRASVVLTCYCWLLVRVSEPEPPPEEEHPAVDRWAHLRVPARAGGAWGQRRQSRAECVLLKPYRTLGCWTHGQFSYSLQRRGFARSGVQVLLDPHPRDDLGPGLGVLGDTPSTQQE